MNTSQRLISEGQRRFMTMMEQTVMLWSDDKIERERSEAFVRWCFDTGNALDLIKFNTLDREKIIRETPRTQEYE